MIRKTAHREPRAEDQPTSPPRARDEHDDDPDLDDRDMLSWRSHPATAA